jgi:alkanesulfonate monooxygenase SsuD/methylene tetrahydromethanopterin reductase-like flavin-dependent oxidoreductase (luciferase family)
VRFSLFSVTDHYPDQRAPLSDRYARLLDEIVLAEELGYDGFFLAEHHFSDYGVVPSPAVLLGAAAARTDRIGLGVAVSVLPFHDPLLAAEEYAMLDQLSGGRVMLGVGSGYLAHEFAGFGIGPWEKRARFDEALQVMTTAWRGEPFTHHGLYHHVTDTGIAVTPVQRPHPPLWVAVVRAEAARFVGAQGRSVMLIPYATCDTVDDLGAVVRDYHAGLADADADADAQVTTDSATANGTREVAAALHCFVGERQACEPYLDRYVLSRAYARPRNYDELLDAGLILTGTPDDVTAQLARIDALGVDHVLLLANFGAMPHDLVAATLTRFAREVMPRFARATTPPSR